MNVEDIQRLIEDSPVNQKYVIEQVGEYLIWIEKSEVNWQDEDELKRYINAKIKKIEAKK